MFDKPVDYLRFRHGRAAKAVRAFLFRAVVGKEGWPITLRAPESAAETAGLASPHLYVHLPFCERICPHCPYNKTLHSPAAEIAYGRALRSEIGSYLERHDREPISSLYFGGGTPSRTPGLVEEILGLLHGRLSEDADVGIEVHPNDAVPDLLARFRRAGINRISLGVETFKPEALHFLGRTYTPDQAAHAIEVANQIGFDCIDANLIYGIPGQAPDDPARDAERCLSIGIDQISAYPLFTFVHTAHGRQSLRRRLPLYGERARLQSQKAVSKVCREGGLERTSVWSFTRPGVHPYSTVTREDYVGFGAGAGSKVAGLFWFNTFSVPEYSNAGYHRQALIMQASDRLRRFHWLYWQIYRTEIDPERYQALFGRGLKDDFGPVLNVLRTLGWLEKRRLSFRLTERGAVWGHRLQSLYSLTYIDALWERCRKEAWPPTVVLT